MERHAVPFGTAVYDWEVPPEWNVREAYVEDSDGNRVIDVAENNLHLLNYSVPVDTELPFSELRGYLYSLPNMLDAIPSRTTYHERDWGFCLRHDTLKAMDDDVGVSDERFDRLRVPHVPFHEPVVDGAALSYLAVDIKSVAFDPLGVERFDVVEDGHVVAVGKK